MLKRFVILGLVLLLVGSAALGWVLAEKRKDQQQTAQYRSKYGSELSKEMEQYDEWLRLPAEKRTALPPVLDEHGRIKTKAQVLQDQQERLKADMDKLAGGEADSAEAAAKAGSDAQALADFLYGQGWQQELSKYKGQKEQKELILNGSIVCMSIGGAIVSWWLLLCSVRLVIGVSSRVVRSMSGGSPALIAEDVRGLRAGGGQLVRGAQAQAPLTAEQPRRVPRDAMEDRRWRMDETHPSSPMGRPSPGDEGWTMGDGRGATGAIGAGQPKKTLKPLASSIKQTATESMHPLNNTLIELTQEVAAIREYASNQQDRVQKLQEGYDWNIIRNFCLRVIRCIDNVENRIRERAGHNGQAIPLQEIRDELLFALESSGIEQFEPEVNSDYRGQEKHTEAVKERESPDDPELTGKIAKVIRPGYQYFVDDKNVKIVRPAMVMLFG